MTIEQRLVITLDEVLGFQFECSRCHVKVIVPLFGDGVLPHGCRGCGNNWVVNENSRAHSSVFTTLDTLRQAMKHIATELPNVGCAFRVEITAPETIPLPSPAHKNSN